MDKMIKTCIIDAELAIDVIRLGWRVTEGVVPEGVFRCPACGKSLNASIGKSSYLKHQKANPDCPLVSGDRVATVRVQDVD